MSANPDTAPATTPDDNGLRKVRETVPGYAICSVCSAEGPSDMLMPWQDGTQICDTCLGLNVDYTHAPGAILYDDDGAGWCCMVCGLAYAAKHVPDELAAFDRPVLARAVAYQHLYGWSLDELRASLDWAADDLTPPQRPEPDEASESNDQGQQSIYLDDPDDLDPYEEFLLIEDQREQRRRRLALAATAVLAAGAGLIAGSRIGTN